MKRQKISTVLITKNEEKNIRRCLDSLSWVDEIVIVDDGSKDNTFHEAQEAASDVKNLTVIKNVENFGKGFISLKS